MHHDDSLLHFLTNFVKGSDFIPQATVTQRFLTSWVAVLYATGLIQEPVKYDRKVAELMKAGYEGDDLHEELREFVLYDTDIFFMNKHEDPTFSPAVRHCCCWNCNCCSCCSSCS